ncbi:hypothetical protein Lal_00018459 [Lupinus albus]|nr:hypothetical protein Lal_00018459 [Lupinus albus]
MFNKIIKNEANQAIAICFHNNVIPFNVTKINKYYEMFKVKYLKEGINLINVRIEEQKADWKKVSCTIMIDGWTDMRQWTILNFLVNNPKRTFFLKCIDTSYIAKTSDIFKMIGNIVEEFREDNVIQFVTDNAYNSKRNSRRIFLLMETQFIKNEFSNFSFATTHKGRGLVKLGLTHFSTSYLTFGCLNNKEQV